ncbi:unnamed protein product [Urochloa decumbens]|uniref:Late embryogenesis abundant protein LEA-2 subgroup domain-containing protein n=1 Tax=Urochloa decumbens TaxID=240449 RepID=A0ABC9C4T1_9POAL
MLICCDSCCGQRYDNCCDRCCPCIGYVGRDCIFNSSLVIFLCVAAILAIALPVAAFCIVRQPSITVEDAVLTTFNLSSYPEVALSYNFTLNVRVRNHNWVMNMKFTEPLEATFEFDGNRFDRYQLANEGQKDPAGKSRLYHVNITAVSAYEALGSAGVTAFKRQRAAGVFQIDVTVAGEVKYAPRPRKCKIKAACPVELQLAPTSAVGFRPLKCKLEDPEKYC